MADYFSRPLTNVYTFDEDTGKLTCEVMHLPGGARSRSRSTSPCPVYTPGAPEPPTLGKDTLGVVGEVVIGRGQAVYFVEKSPGEASQQHADGGDGERERHRERILRRARRDVRETERMALELEAALMEDAGTLQIDSDDSDSDSDSDSDDESDTNSLFDEDDGADSEDVSIEPDDDNDNDNDTESVESRISLAHASSSTSSSLSSCESTSSVSSAVVTDVPVVSSSPLASLSSATPEDTTAALHMSPSPTSSEREAIHRSASVEEIAAPHFGAGQDCDTSLFSTDGEKAGALLESVTPSEPSTQVPVDIARPDLQYPLVASFEVQSLIQDKAVLLEGGSQATVDEVVGPTGAGATVEDEQRGNKHKLEENDEDERRRKKRKLEDEDESKDESFDIIDIPTGARTPPPSSGRMFKKLKTLCTTITTGKPPTANTAPPKSNGSARNFIARMGLGRKRPSLPTLFMPHPPPRGTVTVTPQAPAPVSPAPAPVQQAAPLKRKRSDDLEEGEIPEPPAAKKPKNAPGEPLQGSATGSWAHRRWDERLKQKAGGRMRIVSTDLFAMGAKVRRPRAAHAGR